MTDFVHLHTHTCYSLLDGACRIDRLISHAKELGQKALAITDHGVMYGVVDFYKEAKRAGIKPIIGCEVYVAPRGRHDKVYEYDSKYSHLILLAKNNTGYKNLMKLVSLGHTEGFYIKPRVDKDLLCKYSEGLICLSACIAGEIPKAILKGDMESAYALTEQYISIFGKENFFLELQSHGLEEESRVNINLVTIANKYGIGVVATNDVHYVEKEDAKYQDILMCIQTRTTVSDTNRMKFNGNEYYLKSGDEMQSLFPSLKKAVENTVKIADMCNVELQFGTYHLPEYPMDGIDVSPFEHLTQLCKKGLSERYTVTPELEKRLAYELDTIRNMGFVNYFLIVRDFIHYAKANDIAVGPGRGSAAGSLVAYSLGITEIDPIKYDLLFERFLNPERITMPDIDIDFCVRRRGEVINYVSGKYGRDKVAQIITFGTLSARSVVRDVGRALGLPNSEVDTIAKMIPFRPGQTIDKAMEEEAFKKRYESDPMAKDLIDCARKLEGLPRHASTHAAGVVITKNTLSDYVPLQLSDDGVITQFPMTTLEELGLLKMDFLGLKNLTIIQDTINLVNREDITLDTVSMDEKRVYELIASGNTDGVFQLESAGMRAFMRELKPSCMEDIIAGISLYRPGPAESIPRYIANKNNPDKITYKHPLLEPILKSTYGCIVYQEQVMQIVQSLAGYSLGRADLLRRAMGKKKPEVIAKERDAFVYGDDTVDGAVKRGVPEKIAHEIFNEMAEFGKYAFNKSHAAAYAMVAYRTAYLKTFFPVQFMCTIMSLHIEDTAKLIQYINVLPSMGIRLLPPDIQRSEVDFAEYNGNIIFGLNAVKNVGRALAEATVKERQKGEYVSMTDYCTRMQEYGVNKRALEYLVRAGAFDSLGGKRSQYLYAFDKILDMCQSSLRSVYSGQMSLLDDEPEGDNLPDLQELSKDDILAMEKEATGVYVTGHPLDKYKDILENSGGVSIASVVSAAATQGDAISGKEVSIAGIITGIKVKYTKNDEAMAFVRLEDMTGIIEIVVFPKALRTFEKMIVQDKIVRISGTIDTREGEAPKVLLRNIANAEMKNKDTRKLYIKVPSSGEDKIPALKEILQIYHGDTPVVLYYESTKKYFAADRELYVEPTERLMTKIKEALGEKTETVLK